MAATAGGGTDVMTRAGSDVILMPRSQRGQAESLLLIAKAIEPYAQHAREEAQAILAKIQAKTNQPPEGG